MCEYSERLLTTLDVLREHILEEQDGVFPATLSSLSGTDRDTVDAVRARVGTVQAGTDPAPAA